MTTAFRRGLGHLNARRFDRARAVLADAVRDGGPERIWATQEFVQACLRGGDHAGAEAAVRELLASDLDAPLREHAVGYLWRRLGRAAEARALLEELVARREHPLATELELGILRYVSGDATGSRRLLRHAARAFERAGDDWGLASALTHQAAIALLRWRFGEALALFARARTMKEKCGDLLGLATVLSNEGYVRFDCWELAEARERFDHALRLQRRLGSAEGVHAALSGQHACSVRLGDWSTARVLARRALHATQSLPSAVRDSCTVLALTNLAEAEVLAGRPRAALAHALRALELARISGDRERLAMAASPLADLLGDLGRHAEALDVARIVDPESLGPRSGVILRVAAAEALLAMHRSQEALIEGMRALRSARAVSSPQRALFLSSMAALVVTGRACLALGRPRAARRHLESAATKLDELIATLAAPGHRMAAADAFRACSDALIECALREGDAEAAWNEARRAKARELRHSLRLLRGGTAVPSADAASAATAAEVRQLALSRTLTASQGRRLRSLRRKWADLEMQRTWIGPAARRQKLQPAASVGRRLGTRTVLLEYHCGETTTWLFVVRDGGVRCIDLGMSERSLGRAVRRLAEPLHLAGTSGDVDASLDAFDVRGAKRLAGRLVGPALEAPAGRSRSPVDRLIIVPDGPLHELPFELLCLEAADTADARTARYLGDEFAISLLASSTIIDGPAPHSGHFTGVAFSPRTRHRVQRPAGPLTIGPLPCAEMEVRSASRGFRRRRVLVGADATPRKLLDSAQPGGVVHVASHAVSDVAAPGLSGLVLAGHPGIDFLTAEDLRTSRLPARLVVLSACSTAVGPMRRREGAIALPRALLQAGARAVLATRWSVDDVATLRMVQAFYSQLGSGLDPARALASARRSLRRAGTHAHPFFWAAFSLIDMQPARR